MADADYEDNSMEKEGGEAFIMPLIPEELDIDPVLLALLHASTFVELSGNETVELQDAVRAMEYITYYLHRMPREQIRHIQSQLDRIVEFGKEHDLGHEFIEFVSAFLTNAFIDEDEDD